jgi:hypothetical protein
MHFGVNRQKSFRFLGLKFFSRKTHQLESGVLKPCFAFKKSKKLDPIKISILQFLRDANFLGPSRLQD